jgi:hypothetical protein
MVEKVLCGYFSTFVLAGDGFDEPGHLVERREVRGGMELLRRIGDEGELEGVECEVRVEWI